MANNHNSCSTHCCKIHGCKYGYDDCPVVVTDMQGMTGGCEQCGLEQEGYYGDPPELDRVQALIEINRLEAMVRDLQSGMYINCIYCGHRYGPANEAGSWAKELLTAHVMRCPKHPMSAMRTELLALRSMLKGNEQAIQSVNIMNVPSNRKWQAAIAELCDPTPESKPEDKGEDEMAKFMAEYEMEDWVRKDLEDTWRRVSAQQSKEILWEQELKLHPQLGGSLEAALQNRDLVACWIVTHHPHPSPPVAVIDMGIELSILRADDGAAMKQKLPANALQPFAIPAGQEL